MLVLLTCYKYTYFGTIFCICRYPWGQEAFDKAKNENKPIFLSGERNNVYFILFNNNAKCDNTCEMFVNLLVSNNLDSNFFDKPAVTVC